MVVEGQRAVSCLSSERIVPKLGTSKGEEIGVVVVVVVWIVWTGVIFTVVVR